MNEQWREDFPNELKENSVPLVFCNCACRFRKKSARKPLAQLDVRKVTKSEALGDHI